MIRKAELRDVPAMLEIYRPYVEKTAYTFECEVPTPEAFTERFHKITAQFPWFVWEEDGEILAYCYAGLAFARKAYGWDADMAIYVKEEHHKKGVGRQLYTLVEEILRKQGYFLAYGIVTSSNEASCGFHRAMGYRAVAEFPDNGWKLGQWHSVTWFEKRLREGVPEGDPKCWKEVYE